MDAVGSERAAVMGESEGGPLAMLFAAAHPGAHGRLWSSRAPKCASVETTDWPWGEGDR